MQEVVETLNSAEEAREARLKETEELYDVVLCSGGIHAVSRHGPTTCACQPEGFQAFN